MKERIFDIIEVLTYITGILFVILAFLLIHYNNDAVGGLGSFSVGTGIIALGIAFRSLRASEKSIGIAKESSRIAKGSDEKMIANANESFLKIVDVFEDKRIQLLQHPDWLGIEGTIWKCQTYLDRAIKLKESAKIDVDNQNKLFDQFDFLINRTGLPWGNDAIKPSDFKNIHKMEAKFLELDLTDESKEKLKRIKEYVKKKKTKKRNK